MKKLLSVALSLLLLASVFSGCSRIKEVVMDDLKSDNGVAVVSFNVAGPWGNVAKGTGAGKRVKRFAAYMNSFKPDIIGTQEMNYIWMDKLAELMPDYDSYGVKRGGDSSEKNSEMNSIFWLKDKYECVEQNTFWLSETPDKESKYEGAACYRICSYVMLRDKQTDKYILALNTHLDHISDEARTFGAQLIMDKLDEIRALNAIAFYDIVLTGDFNGELESEACQLINEHLNTVKADGCTYQDWGEITEGEPIDFVFTTGTPEFTKILDDKTNGFVSDHYGVYSLIDFN